jgi:hypothetical protein
VVRSPPLAASMSAVIHLKKDRERSLLGRHPWVFSGAIHRMEGAPKEGDLVEVRGSTGRFLGRGFYGDRSICAKILSFDDREIDLAFFIERLRSAVHARSVIGLTNRRDINCYRMVHGEGDGPEEYSVIGGLLRVPAGVGLSFITYAFLVYGRGGVRTRMAHGFIAPFLVHAIANACTLLYIRILT